ncbi:S16 family serine protease [Vulcanisaeta souniana]|uniref:Peptidase S16 n=1 Tax=Vulcanisaeta souniana JCM 11219 TaxID=1293586 RepID=A0A830E707_9CREN|nr:S16 family serine protease [Vulcanisaeta souniana]BDR93533.1 peptidase S16 [Vulcanisaeta souniana JCM 11219]GGI77883.1 peptidase S16 [Vulcanisaeta souniana JCM 11219]
MNSNIRRISIIVMLVLSLTLSSLVLASTGGWQQLTIYARSTVIHALAVSTNNSGAVINITITAIEPGSGYVYVAASPLPTAESGTFLSSSQIAALVATYLANQPFNKYNFTINVEPTTLEIGGPSASGYVTVAMWTLITNNTLNPGVVMTGMILPDGSIGPVGGLPSKIAAAAQEGYKVILIPYGQQIYQTSSGQIINLVNYGRSMGVDVVPIMDVRQAIYYFTGVNLSIPVISSQSLKNQAYINVTKFLWMRIYNRTINTGAINSTDPNVSNYVKQAINYAGQGMYYTAASLGFQGLINYYQDQLQNYTAQQLNELLSQLNNQLNNYENTLQNYNMTTANIDIMIGIYDRIFDAQQSLSAASQDLSAGDISNAIINLAYAKARIETLGDWLAVLNAISGGSVISTNYLEELTSMYLVYAQSITEYTLSLSSAVGVSNVLQNINSITQEVQEAQNNYQGGLYPLALAQSLDAISSNDAILHLLFTPVINGEMNTEYLVNITEYVKELAVYNTYEAENRCGLFPMLAISYIDYGNYYMSLYNSTNDISNLSVALQLYELAASYSQALYELATSSNSCGATFTVSNIVPISIGNASLNALSNQTVSYNTVPLIIGIALIVLAAGIAVFSIKSLKTTSI